MRMRIGFPLGQSGESLLKVKMDTEIAGTENGPRRKRIHNLGTKVKERTQSY